VAAVADGVESVEAFDLRVVDDLEGVASRVMMPPS
jgi:hypothetical protein